MSHPSWQIPDTLCSRSINDPELGDQYPAEWAVRIELNPLSDEGDQTRAGEMVRVEALTTILAYRRDWVSALHRRYGAGEISEAFVVTTVGAIDGYLMELVKTSHPGWWLAQRRRGTQWRVEALRRVALALGQMPEDALRVDKQIPHMEELKAGGQAALCADHYAAATGLSISRGKRFDMGELGPSKRGEEHREEMVMGKAIRAPEAKNINKHPLSSWSGNGIQPPTLVLRLVVNDALESSASIAPHDIEIFGKPADLMLSQPRSSWARRSGLVPIEGSHPIQMRAEAVRRELLFQVARFRTALLSRLRSARQQEGLEDEEAYGLVLAVDDYLWRWSHTPGAITWIGLGERHARFDHFCAQWAANNARDHETGE